MQYGITYKVDKESESVHIQSLGNFKAKGLNQIPMNAEMATANLMEKDGDYFLHVTAYVPKEEKIHNKKAIGIDLGIKNQVAFSNGITTQYAIPASERKIRLYKVFSRAKYDQKTKQQSKRRQKVLNKIKGEFSKENNMKRDINNKLASYVSNNYEFVAYQNDHIHAWQKLWGRRIYQTSIGEFRNALKRKASTPIEIDRFTKTTGICMDCDALLYLNLSDRVFTCPFCEYLQDRDVSAANATINKGLSLRNVGETLAEDHASVSSMLEYLKHIPHMKASIADETRSSKQTERQIEASSVRAR
ncbi:transposase IS605 OrfB [mine drainage metagenome]|uniref:Transposase IS605 OrfB n=1 Tax=mine drainage metagenome TaxID=410659 RepID=T1BZS7_9ZZZZ